MIKLETIDQFESFLSQNPHSVIFKHSTTCPVSSKAYQEYLSFTSNSPVPSAVIHVIESRSLSTFIAELTGVVHQSPQFLKFCNERCCDSFSHYLITSDRIQAVMTREC